MLLAKANTRRCRSQPAFPDAQLFCLERMIPQRMRVLLLMGLLLGTAGAAEPVLHVRARTRIDLQSIQRVPGGMLVRGRLMDVSEEEPIVGRTVAISVDGEHGFYRYAEPTGIDGAFRWKVPLPLGQY